jgi:hydrophobe/amphiphile efflux-1 (HAE1) family protein
MNLSAPFIKRPIATILIMVAIAALGVVAYTLLPISALPDVNVPTVSISVTYPGADPTVMASAVAQPLERQFAVLPDVSEITSQNGYGNSQIAVQFDLTRNADGAAADVQSAISAAGGQLPTDLPAPPTYKKVNPAEQPVIILGLTSDTLPLTTVNEFADTYLAQRLSQIKGVAQIGIGGEQKFAPTIRVNPMALAARGLGLDDVATAVTNSTTNKPLGQLQGPGAAYAIGGNNQVMDSDKFADLVVAYHNGSPVRVRDIGDVITGAESPLAATWLNGKRGVMLIIQRQPGSNLLKMVDQVQKLLPQLTRDLPKAIHVETLSDRSRSIKASFKDVQITLVFTIALVVAVIFLFLRQFWATVIPAVAVPLSILSTFIVMYPLKYTLDNLSLMGLTLAVGLVVDDAIVVLENITRHLEEGKSPTEAAMLGAGEIGFTILSITLSLVAVFIPIFLMSGVIGAMFREFAVVVAVSILASGFISLTLTPVMCSMFLRPPDEHKKGRFYEWSENVQKTLNDAYGRSLKWVLGYRKIVMFITLGLIVLTGLLFMSLPTGFFPNEDTGLIFGYTEAAQNISFDEMGRHQQKLEQVILKDPSVESVGSSIGVGGSTTTGNTGRLYITLKAKHRDKAQVVLDRLQGQLAQVTGIKTWMQIVQNVQIGGRLARSQYQYSLQDVDQDELNIFAPKLYGALQKMKGLSDVASDEELEGARATLIINRDKAARLNVSVEAIQTALDDAFGQRWITQIYAPENTYHVVFEVSPQFQRDPSALDRIYVKSTTGSAVPLSEFVRMETGATPLSVNHTSQFPSVTLSFNLAKGMALGDAAKAIQKAQKDLDMPQGITAKMQGSAAAYAASLKTQPMLIGGAIFAIYIILGVLYESFVHPATILLSLPPATVGALLALKLFGFDMSIVAIIGLIMLIGIVKKNAIMMVDFALQLEREAEKDDPEKKPQDAKEGQAQAQGSPDAKPDKTRDVNQLIDDSIFKAATLRFRPILMTSLAAILGALPIALGLGAGGELRQPLGVVVVSGLLVSQVLTLYTVPVTFIYFERFSRWSSAKVGKMLPGKQKPKGKDRPEGGQAPPAQDGQPEPAGG